MIINIGNEPFKGIAPAVAPTRLPASAATVAVNCKFGSGSLEPWNALSATIATPSKVGTKLSIFLYEDTHWFHWLTDVDVVRSPLGDDSFRRVYFTGDGVPKMTTNDIATAGGGTGYPNNAYTLGLPAPANAPVATPEEYSASATYAVDYEVTYMATVYRCITAVTISEAFDSAKWEAVPIAELEYRAYVYTYVSAYGEIGPPSDPSATVLVGPAQKVVISNMSTAPAGAYNVATKTVYRTNTGTSATEYQTVGSVAVATTTFDDTVLAESLGNVLVSAEWVAPPSDLKGLIVMPTGCLVGFRGKEVCFSAPYQPHAWPVAQRYPVDYDVVAVGAFGTSILVATTGKPYLMTGTDPAAMTMEKMEIGYACVSKRSMVDMGYAVAYAAPEGLVVAGMGQYRLATKDIISKEFWASLVPSSIHAYLYDDYYVGFYDTGTVQGGFVFSPTSGDFTLIDTYATAGYADPATGDLYLQVGDDIKKWDAGAGVLSLTWRSRPFRTARPVNFSVLQVLADAYPVTVEVVADSATVATITATDDDVYRLPAGFRADWWEVEATGAAGAVNNILLATSPAELRQA